MKYGQISHPSPHCRDHVPHCPCGNGDIGFAIHTYLIDARHRHTADYGADKLARLFSTGGGRKSSGTTAGATYAGRRCEGHTQ